MNHKEKMIHGYLYDGSKDGLEEERLKTWKMLQQYNNWPVADSAGLELLIKKILGATKQRIKVKPPFYCDYGYNIHVGENFFANYNLTILDTSPVNIGNNVKIGPNVNIFAASHPINPEMRSTGLEFGIEIVIEDDVWIGGNSVINPGVQIGKNSVIGSGSVVTHNIPNDVVAAGNPCKVIRKISDYDKLYYTKNKKY